MKKTLKKEKGITLIALMITVIILMILAGIGINLSTGMKGSINQSREEIQISALYKIQQAVFENYIKYQQTGVERVLKGIPMEYETEAKSVASSFGVSLKSRQNYDLPQVENREEIPGNPIYYYKLQPFHLVEMGLENIKNDEFMVNYSTGEVFDITTQTTKSGEKLYIYSK